ncbi:MAG: PAS domain-containing sensor histidine kinase [Confluentimicrobium sp.]|jgi:two-component system nitrogen regulation sensor histidine kinase NtrY|uniref:sensor histidine kinase NtrY-like n=1 Tax=Actibacterium sp. TaxID=1872125 RepID=UPI0009DE1583|nr:PAS domain-containing sensor histidine kinase [Actibacterium sp.]MBC57633.1 PAS domain-containing sensor histidine kinase [Actibacterium sp.]MDY6858044.1 PAS domain-containing sensor histidine kinase [Pseudomonadota bacterium]|tara:strand:- start:554 stop:2848 length:2295 start_codon:yes stop_codon:yes gene_type:complete
MAVSREKRRNIKRLVVRSPARSATWERLQALRRQRRVQNFATLGLVILGPLLAIVTFLMLGPLDQGASAAGLRGILLADMVYILVVAALVMQRVAQMIAARRRRSAGSRLHLRLTGVFALIALIPTVLVAVFAVLTVNTGLEGWFSVRVRQVVGSSLAAAQAYEQAQRHDLIEDVEAVAHFLNQSRRSTFFLTDGDIRQLLTSAQGQVQRGVKEAYVIDANGEIRARGERSYLFDYEQPTPLQITRAEAGETVLVQDWDNDEFRVLIKLAAYIDRYLYISRQVDGNILNLLDNAQETALFYQQLESERGKVLFEFGLVYMGFALILILAAVWLGLWFAERLSRPVGRLAGAAQRVGAGDFDVRVIEEKGDDEIAMLGRVFNQMTRQLKLQHDALLENNRQIESRRRLFDSVLSSVTAGVIGLDADGRLEFMNRSALRLLGLEEAQDHDLPLAAVVPEFGPLFARLREKSDEAAQDELKVTRRGKSGSLLVRMATRRNSAGTLEGYVVTFDDVTDLVTAQRMAAWGDVARRIAHEIKNPLTPIQLSAERLKRRFRKAAGEDAEFLDQYTDVIIRQTNDLRRIVDEFSKFARMPEPDRRLGDLVKITRDAVLLQESGQPGVRFVTDLPAGPVLAELDQTMISQALTNLIKNAGEATETLRERGKHEGFIPEIRIALVLDGDQAVLRISDNGIGLPEDRARLFEPYVTTRDKGTGLGLPIVKKIVEEHGGTLALRDAPVFEGCGHHGAEAEIRLPLAPAMLLAPVAE